MSKPRRRPNLIRQIVEGLGRAEDSDDGDEELEPPLGPLPARFAAALASIDRAAADEIFTECTELAAEPDDAKQILERLDREIPARSAGEDRRAPPSPLPATEVLTTAVRRGTIARERRWTAAISTASNVPRRADLPGKYPPRKGDRRRFRPGGGSTDTSRYPAIARPSPVIRGRRLT